MINALTEFVSITTKHNKQVLCAYVDYYNPYKENDDVKAVLKQNHTNRDISIFLSQLNFEYNNGYGSQMVYGIIWFVDGSWAERGEYEGSEWWEIKECPPIPEKCK